MQCSIMHRGAFLLVGMLTCVGCIASAPPPAVRKVPGWESLSPVEMLQEAGRICCDASTFEASGCLKAHSEKQGEESIPVRWVFGPQGEYRFEYGTGVVVFDGEYSFSTDSKSGQYATYNMRLNAERSREEEDDDEIQRRHGPHNRYWGDMIMATGMSRGMTYPTAAARLLGKEWVKQTILHGDTALEFGGNDTVGGHSCRKIIGRSADQQAECTLWIDADLGVLQKWEDRGDSWYMGICYDTISVNPKLSSCEFKIPSEAKVPNDTFKTGRLGR